MERDEKAGGRGKWRIIVTITIPLIIIAVILSIALFPLTHDEPSIIGRPAPHFKDVDIDDNLYAIEHVIGTKPILIEFIFTDCHWCEEMTPNMVELYEYVDWGLRMEFISISADERDSIEDVQNFRNRHGANWTFLKTDPSVASDYKVHGTPTYFIIDKAGIVKELRVGYLTVEGMKELIEPYL